MNRSAPARHGLLVLAVAALPSAAPAGEVQHACSIPMQHTTWSSSLEVPKFDTTLGDLVGVTVEVTADLSGSVGAENLSPSRSPNSISATLIARIRILCPSGANVLLDVAPSSPPLPIPPLAPFDGTIDFAGRSGYFVGDLTASAAAALSIPPVPAPPLDELTLDCFTGRGTITFPVVAEGASIAIGGTGNETFQFTSNAAATLRVTYVYAVEAPPECPPNTRDVPGSLLLFPRFDSRMGRVTLISVTNTNCDFTPAGNLYAGTVDVEFVYVGRYGPDGEDLACLEHDRTQRLTPCDTFTTVASQHDPAQQRGFLYAFAKDPQTGRAIVFDHLIGAAVFLCGGDTESGARDQLNARTFLGIGSATGAPAPRGTPTDLDLDGVRDLDGLEYSAAPDELLVPRFLGQDEGPGAIYRSTLTLLNLSGGSNFLATVYLAIYDDSENPASITHSFRCWDEPRLVDLGGAGQGGAFTQDFLADTSASPEEILGASSGPNARKAGWFRIDGVVAASSADQTEDPVVYAVLRERVGPYEVTDLPWELCLDPRGDLFEFGALFDEDPAVAP